MTDEPDREAPSSGAEERLLVLLALLRAEAPRSDDSLTDAVMRTARWQYALRGAVALLNDLAAALLDGALLIFGARRPGDAPMRRP